MSDFSAEWSVTLSQDELLVLFAICQAPPISALIGSAAAHSEHQVISTLTAERGLRARGIIVRDGDTLRIVDQGLQQTMSVIARPKCVVEVRCETPDARRQRAFAYFAADTAVWHTMPDGDLHQLHQPAEHMAVLEALEQMLRLPGRSILEQPMTIQLHEHLFNAIAQMRGADRTSVLARLRGAGVEARAAQLLIDTLDQPVYRAGISIYTPGLADATVSGFALIFNDVSIWLTDKPQTDESSMMTWEAVPITYARVRVAEAITSMGQSSQESLSTTARK